MIRVIEDVLTVGVKDPNRQRVDEKDIAAAAATNSGYPGTYSQPFFKGTYWTKVLIEEFDKLRNKGRDPVTAEELFGIAGLSIVSATLGDQDGDTLIDEDGGALCACPIEGCLLDVDDDGDGFVDEDPPLQVSSYIVGPQAPGAGLAYNPEPSDWAVGVPINAVLSWSPGIYTGDVNEHDVYFGTDCYAVMEANTTDDPCGVYVGRQDVNTFVPSDFLGGALRFETTYFWRVDEINDAHPNSPWEGIVWRFTTANYIVVDDFDSYPDTNAIKAVWTTGHLTKNGAELSLEKDSNFVRDGNSMKYCYRNDFKTGPIFHGSEAKANTSDLQSGPDWTAQGVKALVLYFYGDPCNGTDHNSGYVYPITMDQMYVAVEDEDTKVGIVKYPDMNHIKETSWHEWNIDLADPCLADVNMADVAKIYIGFGGQKTGQAKAGAGGKSTERDTVWFDDIRLYPPRCMPSVTGTDVLHALGDFTEDCNTDYFDLELIAEDWASIDGLALTENRPAVLTGFPDETSHWTTNCAVGTGAIEVNEGYNITVTDPRLYGLTSMSITAWIKQPIDNEFVGIVCSREFPDCSAGNPTELGIYGGAYCCPTPGLGYDWSCLPDCWKFDAELDVPTDGTWTFVAMSVDPTGATLYMKPDGGVLDSGRNAVAHPPQQNFAESFMIGRRSEDGGYFKGVIDDVRIYDYNLSFTDVNNLAYQIADPNPWPVYWYKFDETSGYTAADYGTPTEVYTMNMSPANLVPKDPCDSEDPNLGSGAFDPNNMDIVNFRDYAIMAKHWLEQHLWPQP